jgi:hypothetical protein
MKPFVVKIFIIGVNPYVLLPEPVLKEIVKQAKKDKGPIPVKGTLNGKKYIQTLVKYSGKWRLYLNTPMRDVTGLVVGDLAKVTVAYDPKPRVVPVHPHLAKALNENKKAKEIFEKLAPYRQKEIVRYIASLKTEESVMRNVKKAIQHLVRKERFVGRVSK